ncbi:hypothetical protein PIIN_09921 [Serendipita indica DSM 11827]|uniref:Uncharacterized protein n=1 Tax=Serendipita indica (strain DSM 11827) TaxID=1109443 RepID=G4TX82_SERID|nr:hypothetical protein PIIN_09921 [Serendipita indica DSM 11827]
MQDPSTSNVNVLNKTNINDSQSSATPSLMQVANEPYADSSRVQQPEESSIPSLSTFYTFSTHTLNSGTSFGSLDDWTDDKLQQASISESSTTPAPTSSATYGIPSALHRLSTPILCQIFAIAATICYDTRLHIPLVCQRFRHIAMHNCPQMWDTFELLTGNLGALSSRRQVEYILSKSKDVDLYIGVGIASSRLGSWDPSESNMDEDEDPEWPSTLHRNATRLVDLVASFMPRVVSLVLDVHDTPLEPDLERALQSVFDDQHATRLRRLTMMGTYQLDRVVRSNPISPSLSHLRHLCIAYASNFRIIVPMPQITTLVISMLPEESAPNASSLETTLSNFPNLARLEILGTAPTHYPNDAHPRIGGRGDVRLTLPHVRHLVLERLSLTSAFLSTLFVPSIETLEMREFELGFDPRDVRYDTALLVRRRDGEGTSGGRQLAPLPFGRFLLNNSKSGTLRSLALERLPDMVVRMCVEFVRIVGNPTSLDEARGLERLVIADSKWPDWEPLFTPKHTTAVPLPFLKTLEVQIEHYPGVRSVGGVNTRPEVSLERQEWMDGLTRLAEWRMSRRAVMEMLQEWNTAVPAWLVQSQPADTVNETVNTDDDGDKGGVDPRTVDGISLATGYVDTYPFLHAAWLALQREQRDGLIEETPRSA